MLGCCVFSSSWVPAVEKMPWLPPSWAKAPAVCRLLAKCSIKRPRSSSFSLNPHCTLITSPSLPSLCRGSVFQCTLARLVSRWAIPVGSCIAWSMESSQMASSPPLHPRHKQTPPLGPSSVRQDQGSMCPEQYLLTWSPLSLVSHGRSPHLLEGRRWGWSTFSDLKCGVDCC